MKSKILKSAFVIAIAVMSGINVYNAQKSMSLSDIGLANVEALADGENSATPDCIAEMDAECWLPIVTVTETYYIVRTDQNNYNEILP